MIEYKENNFLSYFTVKKGDDGNYRPAAICDTIWFAVIQFDKILISLKMVFFH